MVVGWWWCSLSLSFSLCLSLGFHHHQTHTHTYIVNNKKKQQSRESIRRKERYQTKFLAQKNYFFFEILRERDFQKEMGICGSSKVPYDDEDDEAKEEEEDGNQSFDLEAMRHNSSYANLMYVSTFRRFVRSRKYWKRYKNIHSL